MSGFNNPIIGGMQKLIRAAIQSPNYVKGQLGWSVNKDGSAELNNVTVRGTFVGNNYVANANGEFWYNGTPGPNTLVMSITNPAGGQINDGNGNLALPGNVSYSNAGIAYFAVQANNGGNSYWSAPSMAGPWTLQGSIGANTSALPSTLDFVTNLPRLKKILTDGTVATNVDTSDSDITLNNNNNAVGWFQATAQYTIRANDSSGNSIYELETEGDGVFENQTISWGLNVDGTVKASVIIGAGFFALGTGFHWWGKWRIYVLSATQARVTFKGGIAIAGTESSGANNNNASLSGNSIAFAYDTTVAHTVFGVTQFGGQTAGQSIESFGSTFGRMGL